MKLQFSSTSWVQFSCSVVSDSLQPHGLQHARTPCPSPTPRAYSNSCPLSWWCHSIISSSVVPFSSHLQSFPASRYFPMSQFFTAGGQSIGVSASASVLPMNTQDWSPLGWTGWISSCPGDSQESSPKPLFKTSILWHSAFFTVQHSHPYMTFYHICPEILSWINQAKNLFSLRLKNAAQENSSHANQPHNNARTIQFFDLS